MTRREYRIVDVLSSEPVTEWFSTPGDAWQQAANDFFAMGDDRLWVAVDDKIKTNLSMEDFQFSQEERTVHMNVGGQWIPRRDKRLCARCESRPIRNIEGFKSR